MKNKKIDGFTLIELLIVVAIIGVLAAISLPAYNRYVLTTHRKAAIADLLSYQQKLERQYNINNGVYNAAPPEGTCAVGSDLTSPANSTPVRYRFTLDVDDNRQGYTLTAFPCDNQKKEKCGQLQIDNFGVKKNKSKGGSDFSPDAKCF